MTWQNFCRVNNVVFDILLENLQSHPFWCHESSKTKSCQQWYWVKRIRSIFADRGTAPLCLVCFICIASFTIRTRNGLFYTRWLLKTITKFVQFILQKAYSVISKIFLNLQIGLPTLTRLFFYLQNYLQICCSCKLKACNAKSPLI